jgi:hypothetical protein
MVLAIQSVAPADSKRHMSLFGYKRRCSAISGGSHYQLETGSMAVKIRFARGDKIYIFSFYEATAFDDQSWALLLHGVPSLKHMI